MLLRKGWSVTSDIVALVLGSGPGDWSRCKPGMAAGADIEWGRLGCIPVRGESGGWTYNCELKSFSGSDFGTRSVRVDSTSNQISAVSGCSASYAT